MATRNNQPRTARAQDDAGRAKHLARRYVAAGILGGALLLALATGITARQAADTQADAGALASGPGLTATGGPYRLSAPNELEPETTGAIPAASARVAYRVSIPNETDPDGTVVRGGTTPLPTDASTSAEFRWDFANYPGR